jgi:hypothetical protein
VSFKLDIDHPDTEMPVALSMLKDDKLASLVDEFFFELHFRYIPHLKPSQLFVCRIRNIFYMATPILKACHSFYSLL